MPGPIRIAHVALQLETGGMERLLAEFARHADHTRFTLQFVTLGSKGRIAENLEACGWRVIALEARPGVRPSTTFRLTRLFRDERIDIVHTHNTKPLLYAGAAARLAGVRGVVHTRHGQRQGSSARQNMLFRLAARCADRVVCVSENSLRLSHNEGLSAHEACTIWNGIDRDRFRFSGQSPSGPALYVGRLAPEKDVGTLLRAAALVIEQLPTFRLQIAGDGVCAGELADLAGQLNISGHVDFMGDVRDVAALYQRASMFVLPSLTEGLPLTVLEAMSCGRPVVATAVGGTPEAVVDGVTGLLVPPANPSQLAGAILRVVTSRDLAARMGEAGTRRVEQHFDIRGMVSRYESLYHEVIRGRAAQAA